jgi:hypothetical protein
LLTARDSRAALLLLTNDAVADSGELVQRLRGDINSQKTTLLEATPAMISYYSEGSSALAADFYELQRDEARVVSKFAAVPVIVDRSEKVRRAVLWAADPLEIGDRLTAASRMAEVIQLETARPFRDTITSNRRRDPDAVGWRRITAGGCKFCQMLSARGAVYKSSTALFASHSNCHCTAQPVFKTNDTGEEADALQYVASRRSRTPEQRETLRSYLNTFYPDVRG